MNYRHEDQQRRQQLLTIVDRGTIEQLFTFLQKFHRKPFQNLADVMKYDGAIDDQIDFIDCTGTKYNVTPLIIAAGKGSYERVKILLVHGANPNKQCATGDTALNLAAHRQKYSVVELLLQYHANPNLSNQAGKTALHRAVASYNNENARQIRKLLDAGADLNLEDRNQRIPLDEAVTANRPEVVEILLAHDQTLVQRAYRAAIIASRLGHDKCLEILFNYGMNPNITDRTNTTPLHVAVRSLQLPTVRLLLKHGADRNIANNRGETAAVIAELLPPDQQQNFMNALVHTPQIALSDLNSHKTENAISPGYPLLRNRHNWTLDSDEFRSRTAQNSSVQNLLDTSNRTYWCCTQSKNAWVIFDLKHQYNLTGVRIVGCENHSTPKNGYIDVSNALNGPWLKVKDFTCLLTEGNKNDFFFPSLETRFIRVFILDNYGGEDIRIQEIGFFGVEMRLVNLLKEYALENSLKTLLANGINDQETLYKKQDEILNSSDKYLHINDHFQFIRLMDSLKTPRLTFLEWFVPPQTTVIAGEKLQIFSVAADEGVTDRIKLEEKLENNPQAITVLMKDLEPIQGCSLVDFRDYTIKHPGRYQIRVISVESPNIHTPWQEIVVGSTESYASKLNTAEDESLYRSSTTDFCNDTTSDKGNTLRSRKNLLTSLTNKDNRAFIVKVFDNENENENEDTEDDTYLISLKSIEESPYYFPLTKMSHTSDTRFVNYQVTDPNLSEHYTQTKGVDFYDHSTNTDEGYEDGSSNSSRFHSIPTQEIYLTPSKYRSVARKPLTNIFPNTNINKPKESDDYEMLDYGDTIIIPTKYRLQQERLKKLLNNENTYYPQQQSQYDQRQQSKERHGSNNEMSPEQQQFRKGTELEEEPLQQKQQSHYHPRQQSRQQNESARELSPEQQGSHYHELDQPQKQSEPVRESPSQQHQSQYQQRQQPLKRTQSEESLKQQPRSQYHQQGQLENQNTWVQNPFATPPQQQQSQYHQRQPIRAQNEPERELSPKQQESNYYEIDQSQKRSDSVRESPPQQQQSQYHQRQQARQQNESKKESSPQQQSNYYEIEQSHKRSASVHESPPRQQQSQYHKPGQLENQNTWVQNPFSTPPQQQQSQYHQRQPIRPRNESERELSPQQQQSNYYEIDQSQKRNGFIRESPPQQQRSQYYQQQQLQQRNDSEPETSPPQLKQQSRKQNELEQDSSYLSPYYDEIPQPRVKPYEELQKQPYHHQQQPPIEVISQDNLKPIYNRYQVIAGDFELRESPHTDESKPGQMQLILKATLQGPEVQERAKNSIFELVSDRSHTQSTSNINKQNNLNKTSYPSISQSPTNVDRRNQNTTSIVSNHEREYQTESNHNSRSNSISHTVQSPTTRTKPDHDNLSTVVNYPSYQSSSPPNESIKRPIYGDHPSAIESHRQSNNQSPLPTQIVAVNMTTDSANDNDLDGIRERSRSSSRNYTSSKYEKNPLRQTDNSHSSPLLSLPPKSSPVPFEQKSKYFFGENVQNQLSDDEADCEMFGHNSQPRLLTSTNTTRNFDHPSKTNSGFYMNDNNYPENLQFGQQTDVGTATGNSLTQGQRYPASTNQSTVAKTRDSPRDSQTSTSNKQISVQGDYEVPDTYLVKTTNNPVNQIISNSTTSTSGFPQQYQNDSDHSEQNIGRNIKQEQSSSKSEQYDDNQSQYEGDDDGRANNNINEYQDDDHDTHDPIPDDREDRNYINDVDDEDDNLPRDYESHSTPHQSGVGESLKYNPARDTPKTLLPTQYPLIDNSALPESNISSTTQKSKKPLEITVRTADHSHLYTPGIIPPKLPSTPTTDITEEITEREPFDKPHTFRHIPDPYIRDSRDNNERDAEDSDPMSEVRQHNRDRLAKSQAELKFKNYGTQSEEKSTRTIGTMSEPVKTRNFGNDVQPQSSATQTSILLQQQSLYKLTEQDEIDHQPSTSQRPRYDSRTNGYYPSQRSTSVGHQNKYVSSSTSPRKTDYLDYDQHQVSHLSQDNDDPRDQYITAKSDYQRSTIQRPHYSSQTRQHIPSSTSLNRTPPPTVEYRSTSPNDRYRTPSPSNHHRFPQSRRSRSPSPPIQKHIMTSTSRQHTISPPSQSRSRQLQRTPSPPSSRHHISPSTKLHRTPSPPDEYRSTSPNNRHHSPTTPSKNYSRKTKDQRKMVPVETDTSLDGMKPQQHQGVQPESPSTREYGVMTSTERDQPPSTRKNYRLRPVRQDSHGNNYEQIPSKYDESISAEYTRSFDRPKEYTSKPFTGDRHQQSSPTFEQRSDEEEQRISVTFTDDGSNEKYFRDLPIGGSISIPSTPVIQPDSLPRSYGQNKSPIRQKHDTVQYRQKITEPPLHHGQQRIASIGDSPPLNFGSENIVYQPPNNEFTIPFETRYVRDSDYEFGTTNNDIRSSTLKRGDLSSRSNRILLLPVLNSSRTYVFEKQSLPANHVRQSRTNGNFYLATSPTLRSLNASFQVDESEIDPLTQTIDSTNLNAYGLRSQVA